MASPKPASAPAARPRFALPGSEKLPFAQTPTGKAASGSLTVTVLVRPKTPLDPRSVGKLRLTRSSFAQQHGPDPVALKAVRAFAKDFALAVEPGSPAPGRRGIRLTGTAAAMQKAFGVNLEQQTENGVTYRVRQGAIELPIELQGLVEAVLGLDSRPQAMPHFRVARNSPAPTIPGGDAGARSIVSHAAGTSFTPVEIANLYQFPTNRSGAGQTIGIIELGGGYRTADITAYFKSLGLTPPKVVAVSVDKGKNAPTTSSSADGEVMLDIEVAASVAPGAGIAVYFAPNTDQGFIDAISTAVHDPVNKPSVISISWGGPESSWTQQALSALDAACQAAAALGVTITAASGDNGSTDGATGNTVDFPASSPHVLACGGTKLTASGGAITSEVVWNELANNEGATGGGVSNVFPRPSWQAGANVPAPSNPAGGRGVPDVAGDADPATGYTIRVDKQTLVIGGTSAVAPLWAGLIAVANQQNGTSAGFIHPTIYAAKSATGFRDITQGNNGAFSAAPGWDACTGLGSPIASALIPLLATSTTGKKPPKGGKGGKGKKGAAKPPTKTPPKTSQAKRTPPV